MSTDRPIVIVVRSMKLAIQAGGCVADDRIGRLDVAEEDVGHGRFAADLVAPTTVTPIAGVDARTLLAEAEGGRSRRWAGQARPGQESIF